VNSGTTDFWGNTEQLLMRPQWSPPKTGGDDGSASAYQVMSSRPMKPAGDRGMTPVHRSPDVGVHLLAAMEPASDRLDDVRVCRTDGSRPWPGATEPTREEQDDPTPSTPPNMPRWSPLVTSRDDGSAPRSSGFTSRGRNRARR
jgi:hypothetical protein